MDIKMTNEETSTHFKQFKHEPKPAACLGYKDVADFRKLRFHPTVLKWYLIYHQNYQQRSVKIRLGLLRDLPNLEKMFPRLVKDLLKKYPMQEPETNANRAVNNRNRD